MKICRIVYEMPPPWEGLAPHPYEVTVAQRKMGHDITVFCGRWPNAGPPVKISGVNYEHIMREPFPATISFTSSVVLFFKYLLWRIKNKPDLLHCHGHFAIWIYYYRNMLHKMFPWHSELTIPLVVHFHNTAQGRWNALEKEGQFIAPHSKFLQWPLMVFSDKLAANIASACIFVSEVTKKEAIELYGVDPRRCFVVETGVNTEMFHPVDGNEKDKSRKDLGLDSYDKVVLSLGKIVERKNIHLLLDAFALLPETYKLLLVGTGEGSYMQQINSKIGQLGLESRIIKVGYAPYPLNPIAYQVADVFVLPSSYEGLSKSVMQSLATGIPALVYSNETSQQVAGLLYLRDLEPATIAESIKEVVESRVSVDTQRIVLNYSWNVRIKEIEKVYDFAKTYQFK